MSSNSVCNHTRDKQIITYYHWHDYRSNWTPLSPINITYEYGAPFGDPSGRRSSAIMMFLIDVVLGCRGYVRVHVFLWGDLDADQ